MKTLLISSALLLLAGCAQSPAPTAGHGTVVVHHADGKLGKLGR